MKDLFLGNGRWALNRSVEAAAKRTERLKQAEAFDAVHPTITTSI